MWEGVDGSNGSFLGIVSANMPPLSPTERLVSRHFYLGIRSTLRCPSGHQLVAQQAAASSVRAEQLTAAKISPLVHSIATLTPYEPLSRRLRPPALHYRCRRGRRYTILLMSGTFGALRSHRPISNRVILGAEARYHHPVTTLTIEFPPLRRCTYPLSLILAPFYEV